MNVIYEPSGKAREYSPLAANLYTGCSHQCKYCYAPRILRKTVEQYKDPVPRKNILAELEKQCKKNYQSDKQVLFCFMTDPYNALEPEMKLTHESLKLMLKYKIPVSLLTKAGKKCLVDIELFKKFGKHIQIGATLTMDNNKSSLEWEPEAALPADRLKTLETLHKAGVRTWASFEPVMDPVQSHNMLVRSLPFVDVYKIGKLNNYKGLDKLVDWSKFLRGVVDVLRAEGKMFYVKEDLRNACPDIKLYKREMDMDGFNLPPFPKEKQLEMC